MIELEVLQETKRLKSQAIEHFKNVEKEHGMPAFDAHKLCAENGLAHSQMTLGVMYAMGILVPCNYVLAYMWSSIAVANDCQDGQYMIASIEKKMSYEQIGRAQDMALEWFEKHSKKQKK